MTITSGARHPSGYRAGRESKEAASFNSAPDEEFLHLQDLFIAVAEKKLGQLRFLSRSVNRIVLFGETEDSDEDIVHTKQQWLEFLDSAVASYELQSYVSENITGEERVIALIRFFVGKKTHLPADIEKVDWLRTHLFRNRESRNPSTGGWHKNEIQELLRDFDPLPLSRRQEELLAELPALVRRSQIC